MINYDYLYDKTVFRDLIEKQYKLEKQLSYNEVLEGCIHPREEECDWTYNRYEKTLDHFSECKDSENYIYIEETVVYLGVLMYVWGHCLTDNMQRIWFLKSGIYERKFSNCKLVYVPDHDGELPNNFKKLLEVIDIDTNKLIPIRENTKFKKLIIPEQCFFYAKNETTEGRFFTEEYKSLIEMIKKYYIGRKTSTGIEKVYFSYSQYRKNKCFGEDRLEKFFEKQGYTIIAPEEKALEEQMNLLLNCKSFASTIGSCSHNIIFLNNNTEVILIPRAHYLTFYQVALNELNDLNITYIDCCLSVLVNKVPCAGPYLFCVSDNLQRYFGRIEATSKFYKWNYKYLVPYLLEGLKEYERDNDSIPEVYYREFIIAIKRYMGAYVDGSILDMQNRVIEFLDVFEPDKKIYLYGCGHYGLKCKRMLENLHIKVEGFIVSDGNRVQNEKEGLPIYELSEIQDKSSVIIVSVSKKAQAEIIDVLEMRGYVNFCNIWC